VRQCLLHRRGNYQVAWLPSQYAHAGRIVKLKDQDGWRVQEVYWHFLPSVELPHGYFAGGKFHGNV
jgi:hypothetical protein